MILHENKCLCPDDLTFDEVTGQCSQEKKRIKFTSRELQATPLTTQTTALVITGNQTFDGVEFRSWDDTFASSYMITVPNFVPYLQVFFKNCIIDISGKFFQSAYPVKLSFDNCQFRVGNTTELLNLDYSAGSKYGCTADNDINAGDLSISNSNFSDTSLTNVQLSLVTPKNLFKVTSLYDITFFNVSFNGLMQKHGSIFNDHHCTSTPAKPSKITFDRLKVANSNMFNVLNYTNYNFGQVVPAETQLRVTSSVFSGYQSNVNWMYFLISRERSVQSILLQNISSESLTLDPGAHLIHIQGTFGQKGTTVTLNQISATNSKIIDFIQVDNVDSVTGSNIKFDLLNNQVTILTMADPTRNGLVQLNNVKTVLLDNFFAISSSLTLAPVILTDSVTSFTIQNSGFQSIQLTNSDMIMAKKPAYFFSNNVTISSIINSKIEVTKYAYQLTPLFLIPGTTQVLFDKPALRNSQVPLLSVKGILKQSSQDMSKYQINLQFCTFQNNLFSSFDLLGFTDLPTSQFDLVNNFCLDNSMIPTCSVGSYYDTILKSCTPCPVGCSSCISESRCTACSVPRMSVDPLSGSCVCPDQEYYFEKDGNPRCRQCLSKCLTCNNEYMCQTYKTCPNQNQRMNLLTQQCQFQCTSGYLDTTTQTCKTCQDTNCAICDRLSGGSERCGLCQNGFFLDLKTYTCKPDCPALSKKIESTNTYSKGKGFMVKYCRPYVSTTPFQYEYYIDPTSTSHIELGTLEYPFKNMDTPAKEVFNFMFEKDTNFTVYHRRGTSMKMYYGIMPITVVNVKMYNLVSYGDPSLANPRIYVTGHEYLWPDSTLFSTAEIFYDYAARVQRGDMDVSESTKFFLKFSIFRSSMAIKGLDFQSIMFGDAWSNPLIFSFDAPNRTVVVEDSYLDLDGAFYEAYFPISLIVRRSHFNVTNYQYGVWNDFRWDCYANNATDLGASLLIEDNLFTDKHQQALYNFFFFSSFDDFILRNNTFDAVTYLDMETRPFVDVHPQSMCDPDYRTQHITIDHNKFLNLDGSSLMFAINYMNNFNGTKIFSLQNNVFLDTIINSQLISMQIQNPSQVNIGNNYYKNVTILKDKKIFYFFSEKSNITIKNETLIDNTLDDLYTIGSAKNVFIEDFDIYHNDNTGAITETSAILRISTAANMCQITRFKVGDSIFRYGKAIEIESAKILNFSNALYFGNTLQNQDFLVFNQIVQSQISNLTFISFLKVSDKSRYAISMPTLSLVPGVSSHILNNISFTQSKCSFIQVSQVQTSYLNSRLSDPGLSKSDFMYRFNVSNCNINNNTLFSKDALLDFGEINYQNFSVSLKRVHIIDNTLELGTIYQMKLNCKEFIISESQILRNTGQFALLEPASSDESNPLNFYIHWSLFVSNFARADAMIQLTSNSALRTYNSRFIENFSLGRGSVVFADYQLVYVLFDTCDFIRNYAYQGGAFYVQYSSQIEVSNCYITQNFAVTGGVAYVNNDGQIKINKGTRVFQNSALNSCFLFLINSQYESQIDNITITSNDQKNAMIQKDKFLSIFSSYMYFKPEFFNAMQEISDKVQRTINERADTAIYAIKAKINFTNTEIYENDVILSASTESVVSLVNTTIRDIQASSRIITAVSSTIEFYRVILRNVTVVVGDVEPLNWEASYNTSEKTTLPPWVGLFVPDITNASSLSGDMQLALNTIPPRDANGMINNVYNIPKSDQITTASTQAINQQSSVQISPLQKLEQASFTSGVAMQLASNEAAMASLIPQKSSQFFKISIVNKSFMRAFNCTFEKIEGTFMYASGSSVVIDGNTTIQYLNSIEQESELFLFDNSNIQISDADFRYLTQLIVTPILRFQESQLIFNRGSFSYFNKVLFFLEGGKYQFDNLHVSHGNMTWINEPYMVNSIVFDVSAADLSISNGTFVGIFSSYSSPIIYIENDPQATEKHSLSLIRSTFYNNVANESAGVLLAVNTNVTIDSCVFDNNTALLKDAGAIFLDCQDSISTQCTYNISNSIFKNNKAGVNGGAIKYTFYPPNILKNNTFTGNMAQYGQQISSYPVQIKISNQSTSRRLGILPNNATSKLNLGPNAVVFELDNALQSGALMTQSINFEIMDQEKRTLITDNQSIAIMSSQSPNVTVMKSKSVKANSGVFEFNDVIVVGPPGTEMLLKVSTDSISREKIDKAYPGLFATLPEIFIKGRLRLCLRGEFQTTDYKCIQCSDGFFTLKDNEQQCYECPENAVCSDGFNIALDQGYWRNDSDSIEIYECYNKKACKGTNMSTCENGYRGNLCHSCGKAQNSKGKSVWYSRESNNECAECLEYSTNAARLSGVTILIIAYFALLIWVNISAVEHGQNQRISTVCMRILTNYFQILTLASSYDLSWSDNMKTFLQWISIIAQSSQILFSVDCFIKDNEIDIEPQYFKMILAIIFPAICIFMISIFWFIFGQFKKNTQTMTRFVMSVTILIFMTLPAVTTITFAIYNCVDVFADKTTYLALDVGLQCWTGAHNFYATNIGIPIIVIWIVGLPLSALIIMYRQRKSLADENNLARYGFLYTGLNHSAFYWEILLHFRKVIMICINVFLTTFKPLYRALIGFMLMIIYIELLQKVQPYSTQEVNDLEFKANIAAFATFYGGLFFISSDLHFSVTLIMFFLILIVNAIFWWTWIRMVCLGWIRQKLGYYLAKLKCCRNSFLVKAIQGEAQDINQINAEKIQEIELAELADESQMARNYGPGGLQTKGGMRGGPHNVQDYDMDQEYYEENKVDGQGQGQRRIYEDYENDIIHKGTNQQEKPVKKQSKSKNKGNNMYKTVDQTQFMDMSVRHGFNNQIELDESRQYEEQAPQKSKSKRKQEAQQEDDFDSVDNRRTISKDHRSKQASKDGPAPQIKVNGEKTLNAPSTFKNKQGQSKTIDMRSQQQNVQLDDSIYENSDQDDEHIIEDSSESQQQQTGKAKKKKKKIVKRVVKKSKNEQQSQADVMLRKNTTINNKDGNYQQISDSANSSSFVTESIDQLKGSTPNVSSGSGDAQTKAKTVIGDTSRTKSGSAGQDGFNNQSTPISNISSQPQNKQVISSSDDSSPKLPLPDNNRHDRSHSHLRREQEQAAKEKIREISNNKKNRTRKGSNTSMESPKVYPKDPAELSDGGVVMPTKVVRKEEYQKQMEKKGRNRPDEAVKAQKGGRQQQQNEIVDLSQQQQQEDGPGKMNRTAQEQEKMFSKQRPNIDKTMQNFAKKDQYKKMQSRKISSHDEASHSDQERSRDSSEAEETKRQMISQPQKRSKSRPHAKKQQIDDDSGGQGGENNSSSLDNPPPQQQQQQRKVSKLRPKHMRNEAQEATKATPSMFTKPKQQIQDSDDDNEEEEPVEQQNKKRKNRHNIEDDEIPQPRERKSKTREGSRRDRSKKKRNEIRDSLSP